MGKRGKVVKVQDKPKSSEIRESNLGMDKPYLAKFAKKLDNESKERPSHGTLQTRVRRETTDDQ